MFTKSLQFNDFLTQQEYLSELQGFDYDDVCEVIEVLEKQGFVVTDNDLSEINWNSYNILKKE